MKFNKGTKAVCAGIVMAVSGGMMSSANAADLTNTIRGGVIVNPIGTVSNLDYEHLLNDHFALGARVGGVSYDYDDGSYHETGTGNGVELVASYYPSGEGFKGFYLSGGVGFWSIDWDWTDPYNFPTYGNGSSDAVDVNVDIGWKIPLGSPRVYFQPSLTVGNFFSTTSSSSTGSKNSNLGFYAGAGLHVGVAF